MTPNKRHRYIVQRINHWRKTLEIPQGLKINIRYLSSDDLEEQNYAAIDLSMYEYGRVTLKVYDEVFAAKDFERVADESVFHEMCHLFMHPLTAYCNNMFKGDEGKQAELERLEELVVNTLERVVPALARRQ